MTPQKRPRFGPGEIFILMAIGIIFLVFVTQNRAMLFDQLTGKIFSGASALVAVIMFVEYLVLKGADRSPIYLRELEAARAKRRDDLLALREMETQLVELRSRLAAGAPGIPAGGAAPGLPAGRAAPLPGPSAVPAHPGDPVGLDPAAAALRARLDEARQTIETVLRQLRERI